MAPPPKLPDDEEQYLEGRLAEFRGHTGNERKDMLEQCARRLLLMRGIPQPPEPTVPYGLLVDYFYGKCKNWFNNRIQENKEKATRLPTRINRSWNGERVFEFLKNTDIREAVHADGSEDLHPYQIVAWNLMRRSLWEDLEQDERDKYAAMATQWNVSGPDVRLQPKMAERRAMGWMRSDIKMYWEQCGMIMIMYGLWPDEFGKLFSIRLDTSDYVAEAAGKEGRKLPRFTSNPDWDKDLRANATAFFSAWFEAVRGVKVTEITTRKEPVLFQFSRYPDGTPILSDTEDGVALVGGRRQEVWRQYIRIHYSMAKGLEVKAAPWTAITKAPWVFFSSSMFPPHTVLHDPSHMNEGPLSEIFHHIITMEHPTDGSEPRFFRFAKYMTGNSSKPVYQDAKYDGFRSPSLGTSATPAPEHIFRPPAFYPKVVDPNDWEEFPQQPEASTSQQPKQRKKQQSLPRRATDPPPNEAIGGTMSAAKDLAPRQSSGATSGAPLKSSKQSKKKKAKKPSDESDESDEAQLTPGGSDSPSGGGGLPRTLDESSSSELDENPLIAVTRGSQRMSVSGGKGKGKGKAVVPKSTLPRMLIAPSSSSNDGQERWQYLRALSTCAQYLAMLDRAWYKLQQLCSVEPHPAAPWATWMWSSPHLPAVAHQDSAVLNALVAWLSNGVSLSGPVGNVQRFCLAIGLLLRDTDIVMAEVGDADVVPDALPTYFARSELRYGDVDHILDICSAAFPRPLPKPVPKAPGLPTTALPTSPRGPVDTAPALPLDLDEPMFSPPSSPLSEAAPSSPQMDFPSDWPSPPQYALQDLQVVGQMSSPELAFDDIEISEAMELSMQQLALDNLHIVGQEGSSPPTRLPPPPEGTPPNMSLPPPAVADWEDDSFDARQIEADLVEPAQAFETAGKGAEPQAVDIPQESASSHPRTAYRSAAKDGGKSFGETAAGLERGPLSRRHSARLSAKASTTANEGTEADTSAIRVQPAGAPQKGPSTRKRARSSAATESATTGANAEGSISAGMRTRGRAKAEAAQAPVQRSPPKKRPRRKRGV